MSKVCGTCVHFLNGGDWDLCCDLEHEGYPCGFLCYRHTQACEMYEENMNLDELEKRRIEKTLKRVEFLMKKGEQKNQ